MTSDNSWVECVPNFSEGRNQRIIDQICAAIEQTPDTRLLHVDMGADANRTVVTFAASSRTAVEAGFSAIETAASLIDMRRQSGIHRRIGATDVFPFIPLKNADFDLCIALANQLGRRVWQALGIPVYLYGKAARTPNRVRIPDIRKGGYETLKNRIKLIEYKPDFGSQSLPEKSGATMVGVRDFLLAYNVNLSTNDVGVAKSIARVLRSSGQLKRDENHCIVRDENGQKIRIPGKLLACQADGWRMPSYGLAQVTMNLLDFRNTGLHTAYEAVRAEARKLGEDVVGSEVIGMVPKSAMVNAGQFYAERLGVAALEETTLIALAIDKLGLSKTKIFSPDTKILEKVLSIS